MKILIDTINEETFKALAKGYFKRIKQKDPATTQTLMSVQEDLARVVGHENFHAAQGYWAKQATTPPASEPIGSPLERASHASLLKATAAVRSAVTYLSQTAYAFTRDNLGKASMKFIGEPGIDNPEKWSELTGALIDAPIDDLVKLDDKGNLTTQALEKKRRNLIELSKDRNANRGLGRKEVEKVLVEHQASLPKVYQAQISEVCLSHTRLNLVQALPGARKSTGLLCLKKAYEQSGFHVESIALSWDESKVVNTIMGTQGGETMGSLIEKMGRSDSQKKPLFDKPTLIVVDGANGVGLPMLESFLEKVAAQPQQIKVVMLYRPGTSPAYSTLKLLSEELRVASLTSTHEARPKTKTPFDEKLHGQIEGLALYADVFSNPGLTQDQVLEEIRPGLAKIAAATVRGLEGETAEETFKKRCHQICDAFSSLGAPLAMWHESRKEPGRIEMSLSLKQSLAQEMMGTGLLTAPRRNVMIDIFSSRAEHQAEWDFPERFEVDWKALGVFVPQSTNTLTKRPSKP